MMISIRELLAKALPDGTNVVGGAAALDNEVSWATQPRPTPPAFSNLRGGEMILLSSEALKSLDERTSLERAVRELASLEASSIAYSGRISPAARQAADETGVVLLQLPANAVLSDVEREATSCITERLRDSQRRGQDGGRKLMELAISGEPLPAIVTTIVELAGHSVVLEGRDGRILHLQVRDGLDRTAVERMLAGNRDLVGSWLRTTISRSPAEPPVEQFDLAGGWHRAVAPALGGDGLLGSVSMLVHGVTPTTADRGLLSRAAAACAVVLARDFATMEARREVEVHLLDEILEGALRSEVTLTQAAKRLNYDLAGPHAVIVCRFDTTGQTAVARARDYPWMAIEEIVGRRPFRLLWRARNNLADLLWPADDPADTRAVAAALHKQLQRRIGDGPSVVSIGVGQIRSGLAGIRLSHQEAKQALTLGRRLRGVGGLTNFDELGVYRLIFAAERLPELTAFHEEALSSLIAYDASHGGELVKTLKAFFDAKCGPKEAAGLLDVHRNTVLYRLDRVKEITGLDLDDAEIRLRLHLALCIHLALFSSSDDR